MRLYFVLLVIAIFFFTSSFAVSTIADSDQTTISTIKLPDDVRPLKPRKNIGDAAKRSLRVASCRRTEQRGMFSGFNKLIGLDPAKRAAKKAAKLAALEKAEAIKLASRESVLKMMMQNPQYEYKIYNYWHTGPVRFDPNDVHAFLKIEKSKQYEKIYHGYKRYLQDLGIYVTR
ncbi:hypothetical protein PHYBOEH_011281 [Phytophthora boehmeriae]|uniref:RxLR effector protein n=1 Tax=Phytophthora boehmeriae TaxID=109152 RepID=A0A8T1VIL0_9STRA|nr:hypothetical protein PHYBOEH_011281 [Phytophthora boehmeriae]